MSCGRIGFSHREVDSDADLSEALYISPEGDDSNSGGVDSPFRTFSYALSQLVPGDTLLALPGVYGVSTGTGTMNIDCRESSEVCNGSPCPVGSATAPILIRALEERGARFVSEVGMESSNIDIDSCHDYRIEGFVVTSIDDASISWANIYVTNSFNLEFRRNVLASSNRMVNGHLLEIAASTDILVEENEFYNFHRSAANSFRSEGVMFRRNYSNPREYPDLPGGYVSGNPESGDIAYSCSHSTGCVFENNISEGKVRDGFNCGSGFLAPDAIENAGNNNRFYGNIVIEPLMYGILCASRCDNLDPCPEEVKLTDLVLRDNIFIGSPAHNIFIRGAEDVILDHNSSLLDTIRIDESDINGSMDSSVTITNSLSTSPDGYGFQILDQSDWSIDYSNSFGAPVEFESLGDVSGFGPNNTTHDPALGACIHRIPESSPLSGAGSEGSDIGATVVYRYEQGVLGNELLWDEETSAFPCGAIVAGINDNDNSCSKVHTRLAIAACNLQ